MVPAGYMRKVKVVLGVDVKSWPEIFAHIRFIFTIPLCASQLIKLIFLLRQRAIWLVASLTLAFGNILKRYTVDSIKPIIMNGIIYIG